MVNKIKFKYFRLGPLVLKVVMKERNLRNANGEKLPQGEALKLKTVRV